MREGSTTRRAMVLAGFAATAALAAVAMSGRDAAASNASSTQGVTATVVAGTLTVTAPPALVTSLNPATANTGVPLGVVAYTNTLNDSTSWSVTMTSTDWVNGGNAIHFTEMSVTPGTSLGAGVGSVGTPTAGASGQTLSGTDTTPGTTPSSPITLATGTGSIQGVFTQSGSTMSVTVPGGTPAGVYSGTISYTITG